MCGVSLPVFALAMMTPSLQVFSAIAVGPGRNATEGRRCPPQRAASRSARDARSGEASSASRSASMVCGVASSSTARSGKDHGGLRVDGEVVLALDGERLGGRRDLFVTTCWSRRPGRARSERTRAGRRQGA